MTEMGTPAFEQLIAAHHGEIYGYLLRLTARRSEADDLSQETFLRAYRGHRTLTPGANVRAWLFTIATNLARNHFRGEGRRRRAQEQVRLAHDTTRGTTTEGPEHAVLYNEARARIEALVTRLPTKQRLAFVLRRIHDLDYDTIARSLDCSSESARAHVFQALRKIRLGLDGHELPRQE